MGHKARVELVLDCAEPKRLAKFWREALDYRDYYTDANLAVLVPKEGIAFTAPPSGRTRTQSRQEPHAPRHRGGRPRSRDQTVAGTRC